MSPLHSSILEPHLYLMLREPEVQRQLVPLPFIQVVLKLEAVFQRLSLMVGENRTGPGWGVRLPCCTVRGGVGNIQVRAKEV